MSRFPESDEPETTKVSLESRGLDVGPVHFAWAEWVRNNSRFVLVRYAMHDRLNDLGLRLDLDKRVFLDGIGDPKYDPAIKQRAAKIWEIVAPIVAKNRVHHGDPA